MTKEHYRHTQIGWVMIAFAVVPGLVGGGTLVMQESGVRWPLLTFLGVVGLVLVLLSTLTVSVTPERVRLHFGPGLIHKTILLSDVRRYQAIRLPWYFGYGIKLIPGGVLYNVSGTRHVELQLNNGKRIAVGTDDSEGLVEALRRILGEAPALRPDEETLRRRQRRRSGLLIGGILGSIALLCIGLGWLMVLEQRAPEVELDRATLQISSAMYDARVALTDVTQVSLEQRLPRIRARTNGYALKGTLRGHFRLDDLGEGQLFIEHGFPPYLVVRTREDFVVVNFADPDQTRELYQRLAALTPAGEPR